LCKLEDYDYLKLDPNHRTMLINELDYWHSIYLPVKGTVLDIGAGNGETAFFYLNHGAEHVICIEPDADLLYENFGNDPRVTIIPYAVNSIKSDCEGGEENMVIETHTASKFVRKHRWALDITLWKIERAKHGIGDIFYTNRGIVKETHVFLGSKKNAFLKWWTR
jgi:hypothetical protein